MCAAWNLKAASQDDQRRRSATKTAACLWKEDMLTFPNMQADRAVLCVEPIGGLDLNVGHCSPMQSDPAPKDRNRA